MSTKRSDPADRRAGIPPAHPSKPGARKPGAAPRHHGGERRGERSGDRGGDRDRRPPQPPPDTVYLWGVHAVVEALGSLRRKVLRISATENAAPRVSELAADRGVPVSVVTAEAISARLPGGAVHQGLLLEARRLTPIAIEDVPDDGVVLLLDQITDPHNVGAILRSAAAFGVSALVLQDRHAPDLSGTLAKAASGGLEHVPIALVVNLARTLDKLGERGFFRVGLDSEGTEALEAMELPRPLALVLGSEGDGLRRLTRERCDAIARLDMPGPIKSLNVSNACAVALTVARLKAPVRSVE